MPYFTNSEVAPNSLIGYTFSMADMVPDGIDQTTGQKRPVGSSDNLVNAAGAALQLLQFKGETVLGAASGTITVSGLDGDTDKMYVGFYDVINDFDTTSITNLQIFLRANGVDLAGGQVTFSSGGANGSGGASMEIANVNAPGAGDIGHSSGFFVFYAQRTFNGTTPTLGQRHVINFASNAFGTSALGEVDTGVYANSATNLTSLTLRVPSSTMEVGSRLTIYKLGL
jgi:hypothetical protein